MTKEPEVTEEINKSRRMFVEKSARALAALGIAGAVVVTTSTEALAGCCTDCSGKSHCCSGGTPGCGIR